VALSAGGDENVVDDGATDRIAQEEVFGPVVAVIDALDLNEAMSIATRRPSDSRPEL
jgi:acyl-CoA reductase-like NAD-dependent aldehyde dehydrogenase